MLAMAPLTFFSVSAMWSPSLPLYFYDFAQVGWDFFEYLSVQFWGAFLASTNFNYFAFGCSELDMVFVGYMVCDI